MSTLPTNYSEFNLAYYIDESLTESNNLEGKIKFPIIPQIAKKNYFLRPVARCTEGA